MEGYLICVNCELSSNTVIHRLPSTIILCSTFITRSKQAKLSWTHQLHFKRFIVYDHNLQLTIGGQIREMLNTQLSALSIFPDRHVYCVDESHIYIYIYIYMKFVSHELCDVYTVLIYSLGLLLSKVLYRNRNTNKFPVFSRMISGIQVLTFRANALQ